MKAAPSPRERPHRTPGPRGRVSQQRCRSPEPDCPHRSSPPGTRETASSARDRPPQRSVSSDPSANRGGIVQRESNNSVRFHTTRVKSRLRALFGLCPLYPPKADIRFTLRHCASQKKAPLFDDLVGARPVRGGGCGQGAFTRYHSRDAAYEIDQLQRIIRL